MNLLLDSTNLIIAAGHFDFNFMHDRIQVLKDNSVLFEILSLNKYNASAVSVADHLIPANVHRRYRFIDGQFELIDTPILTDKALAELTVTDMPKNNAHEYMEAKVNRIITSWKKMIDNGVEFTQLPEGLKDGLDYILVDNSELNETQIANKKTALNFINKLKARYRIEAEVGDIHDQVADVDKQLQLITPIVVRMFMMLMWLINDLQKQVPAEFINENLINNYTLFSQMYLGAIASGQYIDRADIEDPSEMIPNLLGKHPKKALAVKEEYIDKWQD